LTSFDIVILSPTRENSLNNLPNPNDSDEAVEPLSSKFSRDSWFLLVFGVFWAGLTGIFVSLLPLWGGFCGLAIAIFAE